MATRLIVQRAGFARARASVLGARAPFSALCGGAGGEADEEEEAAAEGAWQRRGPAPQHLPLHASSSSPSSSSLLLLRQCVPSRSHAMVAPTRAMAATAGLGGLGVVVMSGGGGGGGGGPQGGVVQQRRGFHASAARQSTVILVGGLGVAGVLYGANYTIEAWNAWQESRARQAAEEEANGGRARASDGEGGAEGGAEGSGGGGSGGFSTYYAKRFYDGPFEESMTKREAALILGVRESASLKRVKAAHRKLTILNHPDTGGSTYISTKLNEAKEILVKTADDE
jgi:hypothetical protein